MTDGELVDLAYRALKDPGCPPFDALIHEIIFGENDPPEMWRDWPPEARDIWDRAATVYLDTLRSFVTEPITVKRAWDALLVSNDRSWLDISRRLGTSTRNAVYEFRLLGFKLKGRADKRVIIRAPCIECGEPMEFPETPSCCSSRQQSRSA